jgi:short subunit dehydrogenase-like uncharacterized protein
VTRDAPAIVLIGATGFTGTLIARQLSRGSLPFVLAARDADRLKRLASELDGAGTPQIVNVRDPSSLARLIRAGDAVINCAGPFSVLGEPVVRACVQAGAHYVDTTGEQPFMRAMHERYDRAAREAGIAVVNGMAFEYALGDCAAAIVAEDAALPIRTLDVIYAWGGAAASRGTRRTSLRIAGTRAWMLEGGRWRLEPLGSRTRQVQFESGATRRAVSFGAGEVVTVPRHVNVVTARGWLVMGRRATRAISLFSGALPALLPLLRPLVEPLVLRAPEPDPTQRHESEFTIRVETEDASGYRRAIEVTGRDPYGLTAIIAVRGATRAMRGGPAGVLAPSGLVDPMPFLDSLAEHGVAVTRAD